MGIGIARSLCKFHIISVSVIDIGASVFVLEIRMVLFDVVENRIWNDEHQSLRLFSHFVSDGIDEARGIGDFDTGDFAELRFSACLFSFYALLTDDEQHIKSIDGSLAIRISANDIDESMAIERRDDKLTTHILTDGVSQKLNPLALSG